jgi:hypothetical protein
MAADKPAPLPGFALRDDWARSIGRHPETAKRWQDQGRIVVRYLGRDAYVDLEATAARMRGEDRPRRRRGGKEVER